MAGDGKFKPGHTGGPGRPLGLANRRTAHFQEVLAANNYDAAQALVDCYNEAKKQYAHAVVKEADLTHTTIDSNVPKFLKIAADIAKELASYSYPKLKSIEHLDPKLMEVIDRIKNIQQLPREELLKLAESRLIEAKKDIEIDGSRIPDNNPKSE